MKKASYGRSRFKDKERFARKYDRGKNIDGKEGRLVIFQFIFFQIFSDFKKIFLKSESKNRFINFMIK